MKEDSSYAEKTKSRKSCGMPAKESAVLFLDVLCTYFEEEQILDKEQIKLFRKQWMAEEEM